MFVNAQAAMRLSVVASKSSAESMYSVPLLVVFQLAVVGDVAGWSEYAGPSASGIGAPWNAWYFREPPKSALLLIA